MTGQALRTRLRFIGHGAAGVLLLLVAGFLGWQAGDWQWPYAVQSIRVDPDPVEPGTTLRVTSVRSYIRDCTLFYERRIESVSQPSHQPVILPEEKTPTPWALDGKPQTIRLAVPDDLPCGAAQIRTRPSAACSWLQETVRRQHARDVLTPFDVACPAVDP